MESEGFSRQQGDDDSNRIVKAFPKTLPSLRGPIERDRFGCL
jgi:hypothetical protein